MENCQIALSPVDANTASSVSLSGEPLTANVCYFEGISSWNCAQSGHLYFKVTARVGQFPMFSIMTEMSQV